MRFVVLLIAILAGCAVASAPVAPPSPPEPRSRTVAPAGTTGGAQAGACDLPEPPALPPMLGAVASTRDSARAGYESVGARFQVIDAPFPDTTGCSPTPHTQPLTRASASRIPGVAAERFAHLDQLTFWTGRDPDETSPAVGELYLHGDGVGYVVVRDLDLRKFLYQDIVLKDCAAEPASCDPERLPGDGNPWVGAEPAADGYANEPFDSDRFGCIRDVHGFFAEFNRITKKIKEFGPSTRRLHLTNNCREPGNYELALVSATDGTLWKDHVSLDMGFYGTILQDIDVRVADLGTGLRYVGVERRDDGSYVYEEGAPKVFPAGCSIDNLAPYIGKAQRLLTSRPAPVALELGPIPFADFSEETNAKSGRRDDESIVYAEVIGARPGPAAWRPAGYHFRQEGAGPVTRIAEDADWAVLVSRARKNVRIWAPHTYVSFRDVLAHPFAISAFEVDGRYLGRLRDERLTTDAARLYGFDYRWLDGLRRVEVREAIGRDGQPAADPGRLEFRLLNRRCGKPGTECVNLVVGNVALAPGEETSLVLGIGTQPLRDLYERDVLQTAQQYALTYDADGNITDLVGQRGLGLVVVRRGRDAADEYTIDLVSYERAVPLWRGRVTVP